MQVKLQVRPGPRLAIKHHLNSIVSLFGLIYQLEHTSAHTWIGVMAFAARQVMRVAEQHVCLLQVLVHECS